MSIDHATALLGDRYRLDGVIGSGGMGVVHRAWDLRLGRRVAIKVLAAEAATDPEIAARLRAEGRHLAATEHPNLVTLYDVSDEPDGAYLVMELVEGESLAERLRREGPLAAREVAAIVTGVAAGLSALHGASIVHRDISPANILLGVDGRARLADFGLAHGVVPGRRAPVPDGLVQGTLRYLAPELLDGMPASPASDVYALAAVTYAALLGRPPAVATSVAALRAAHREPPIRPSLLRPGLDPAVDDILLAALGPAAGRPTAYGLAVAVATGLRAGDDPATLATDTTERVLPGVAYRTGRRRTAPGRARRMALALAGAALLLGLGAISLAAVDGALSGTTPLVADVGPTGPDVPAPPEHATAPSSDPGADPTHIATAPSAAPATGPTDRPIAVQAPLAPPLPPVTPDPAVTPEAAVTPAPESVPQPAVRVAVVDRRVASTTPAAPATAPTRTLASDRAASAGVDRRAGARKAAAIRRDDRDDRSGRRGGDDDRDDDDRSGRRGGAEDRDDD